MDLKSEKSVRISVILGFICDNGSLMIIILLYQVILYHTLKPSSNVEAFYNEIQFKLFAQI